eukprot:3046505-Rhodomonas_salina.2
MRPALAVKRARRGHAARSHAACPALGPTELESVGAGVQRFQSTCSGDGRWRAVEAFAVGFLARRCVLNASASQLPLYPHTRSATQLSFAWPLQAASLATLCPSPPLLAPPNLPPLASSPASRRQHLLCSLFLS